MDTKHGKPTLENRLQEARDRAVELAGGPVRVATWCGVTPQAVRQWHRVPMDHVRTLGLMTGLPPHYLRPDRYRIGEQAA